MTVRDKVLQEGGVDLTQLAAKTHPASALESDLGEGTPVVPREPRDEAEAPILGEDSPVIASTADAEDYPEEAIDYDIFKFTRRKEHAVLTRYIGFDDTSIIIPSRWNGLPITIIDEGAFSKAIDVCHITIMEGIEVIGNSAFSECSKLEYIKLPSTLKNIGEDAFKECISLNEILIPRLVTRIMKGTFWRCRNLHKVTLPEQIEEIQAYAFYDCDKLDSIEFTSSIRRIGDYAFARCKSLKIVKLNKGLKLIGTEVFGDCEGLMEAHIPSSVLFLGSDIFGKYDHPPQLTVFCKAGSAMQVHCRDNKIKCAKAW